MRNPDDDKNEENPPSPEAKEASRAPIQLSAAQLSGTKQVELTKLDKEAHLAERKLDSDTHIEDKKLDIEAEKLRIAAEDKRRDDLRALVMDVMKWISGLVGLAVFVVIVGLCLWFDKTAWLTAFVGTVVSAGVIVVAIWKGRTLDFSAFGFRAKTGEQSKDNAPPTDPPDQPPPSA